MRLTTGTGLALLAGAICAYPFLQRVSALEPSAHAAQAVPAALEAAKAATAVAVGQTPAPTIVWYSASSEKQGLPGISGEWMVSQVWRAWSDGRVEVRHLRRRLSSYVNGSGVDAWCNAGEGYCITPWVVVSDASNGYSFRSDINFDNQVDGADLASVLTDWGASPRFDIAPSDCPLNLINPR